MRRERPTSFTAGAKLSVTRTLGTPSAYRLVVLVDLPFSCRTRWIDVHESLFFVEERGPVANRISLLLFCARTRQRDKKGGAGFKR